MKWTELKRKWMMAEPLDSTQKDARNPNPWHRLGFKYGNNLGTLGFADTSSFSAYTRNNFLCARCNLYRAEKEQVEPGLCRTCQHKQLKGKRHGH